MISLHLLLSRTKHPKQIRNFCILQLSKCELVSHAFHIFTFSVFWFEVMCKNVFRHHFENDLEKLSILTCIHLLTTIVSLCAINLKFATFESRGTVLLSFCIIQNDAALDGEKTGLIQFSIINSQTYNTIVFIDESQLSSFAWQSRSDFLESHSLFLHLWLIAKRSFMSWEHEFWSINCC